MLKDILQTVVTRYLVALLNLALMFVNARVLGVEGVGLIGLIWASVSINVTVNSIFSGNTLVYFLNKYPISILYPTAILWIFAGSAVSCAVLSFSGLLPGGYALDIYVLTVLYSTGIAHSRLLLGKDCVTGFNITQVLQGGLLFFAAVAFYYLLHRQDVNAYIWSLYLTNGAAVVVSLLLLLPYLRKAGRGAEETCAGRPELLPMLKDMLTYGLWGSADNIAEAFTLRLNYFLVERFAGISGVGLLDAGTKVSESVWNISRSIASIEYNRIAKSRDKKEQRRITVKLLRLTFIAVSAMIACVMLVPEWVYTDYLFGRDFMGIREVIAALSAGIVAMGCNTILSHYFIGSGRVRYSAISSFTGLAALLAAGSALIPAYGITGSAASQSIAFCIMLLFSLTTFIRLNSSKK
ncbi:MAG: polysaccharide biosynthesis C-terminal domain-containing protein [Tannerellaceae bacterium]|jgi:O-antigen/teichoic acid export membrane protein|nr:polysaccharide biosynthesis C-terminal domain-containing protein [Tannerellaceae bacterium]